MSFHRGLLIPSEIWTDHSSAGTRRLFCKTFPGSFRRVAVTDNKIRSDATAGFSNEMKKAATDLIWPLFASRVMNVDEFIITLGPSKSQ